MTKSRQDIHRNAEELAQKFRRRAAKMLKIRKKQLVFSLRRGNILPKNDKNHFLNQEKVGYFKESVIYHSLLYVLYVIVVIKPS